LNAPRWNVVAHASPVAYSILVLLGYAAVAALLEVNLVFAAFLAGFGLVGGRSGSERRRFAEPLDAIQKVSFAVFIPMYFAIVGTQLDFGEDSRSGCCSRSCWAPRSCALARSPLRRGSPASGGSRS